MRTGYGLFHTKVSKEAIINARYWEDILKPEKPMLGGLPGRGPAEMTNTSLNAKTAQEKITGW